VYIFQNTDFKTTLLEDFLFKFFPALHTPEMESITYNIEYIFLIIFWSGKNNSGSWSLVINLILGKIEESG
jgi:hypothetical protein